MTRPTLDSLRTLLHGPPPPRNTTEPCRTCADAASALAYDNGLVVVFCHISRERAGLYPMLRGATVPEHAIMPCWRAKGLDSTR